MALYHNEIKYNNFLINNNINPNQFDFCWKLYNHKIKNTHLDQIYNLFNKIKSESNNTSKYITKEEIDNLITLGFVKVELKTKSQFPDIYMVTDKFIHNLFVDIDLAFEELIDNYPKTIFVNNIEFNAINIEFEEAQRLYSRKINNSMIKHNEILKELKSQNEKQLINCGLDKWIKSEAWRLNSIEIKVKNDFI